MIVRKESRRIWGLYNKFLKKKRGEKKNRILSCIPSKKENDP
jgi:hypothetical protein